MLEQWVQATLEWEDSYHLGQPNDNLSSNLHQVGPALGEHWSAEYVDWNLVGANGVRRSIGQGQPDGKGGVTGP